MEQLTADYFAGDDSIFSGVQFRRRFRMQRPLFIRIVDELGIHDNFFQQGTDAVGKMGATPLQKVTAACRLLAYGTGADQLDEWIRLSESMIIKCLQKFVFASIVLSNAHHRMTCLLPLVKFFTRRFNHSVLGFVEGSHLESGALSTSICQFGFVTVGRSSFCCLIVEMSE